MKRLSKRGRELAKALLGNPTRVVLGVWALERGAAGFYQGEALDEVKRLGGNRSQTETQLRVLVSVGMLELSQPGGSQRKVLYGMNKRHPAWAVFEAAAEVCGLRDA